MCLRVWGTGVHSSKVTFFLGGPVSLAVQRFDCDDCSLLVSSFSAQCGYFRRASASRNPRPAQVQRHGPPQRGFMPLELSARTCVGAVGQGERANHPRRRPTHSPAAGRMQILRWHPRWDLVRPVPDLVPFRMAPTHSKTAHWSAAVLARPWFATLAAA
jgi:hypothetical protein